jgi:transposase-like protein
MQPSLHSAQRAGGRSAQRPCPGAGDRSGVLRAPRPVRGDRLLQAGQPPGSLGYRPREPDATVLHEIVHEHLETFLAEARLRGGGSGLPSFVESELRDLLTCGRIARGFARFRCHACKSDLLVAFSCKGRGLCPSCTGRRMATIAAHLTDTVLGGLPVRQWVLSLPHRLRYALAWDHRLCRRVLAVFLRVLLSFERRRARRLGYEDPEGGAVTAIQRFGSALNLNVHFHCLAVEGVFARNPIGELRFVALPEPTDDDVKRILAQVARRVVRLARRHGIDLDGEGIDVDRVDPQVEEFPVLASFAAASVTGVTAMGPEAGCRPQRLAGPELADTERSGRGRLHARLAGFDLHAGVAAPAGDRSRLEHLCRYVLRPPVAQDALERLPGGSVLLHIRRPWSDGTRAIVLEPLALLARLAALIPRPRVNLLIYHGILAPHAKRRREALAAAVLDAQPTVDDGGPDAACRAPLGDPAGPAQEGPQADRPPPTAPSQAVAEPRAEREASPQRTESSEERARSRSSRWVRWADLLRRVFEIDVLTCRTCGGPLRLVATIEDPMVLRRILRHLGLPSTLPEPLPARAPPRLRALAGSRPRVEQHRSGTPLPQPPLGGDRRPPVPSCVPASTDPHSPRATPPPSGTSNGCATGRPPTLRSFGPEPL